MRSRVEGEGWVFHFDPGVVKVQVSVIVADFFSPYPGQEAPILAIITRAPTIAGMLMIDR